MKMFVLGAMAAWMPGMLFIAYMLCWKMPLEQLRSLES